jgi:hypothetical protein
MDFFIENYEFKVPLLFRNIILKNFKPITKY